MVFAQELVRLSVIPLRDLGTGCRTLGNGASATGAIQTLIGRLAVSLSQVRHQVAPIVGQVTRYPAVPDISYLAFYG